uniref:Uncharacterized protein n=1 Tax=Ananas comosus var. bracteatus TaxID=296719 RepID=A0A6V7P5G2_ANACO|nr:unnamed protein product [Ananas comosus var. bracteatus]
MLTVPFPRLRFTDSRIATQAPPSRLRLTVPHRSSHRYPGATLSPAPHSSSPILASLRIATLSPAPHRSSLILASLRRCIARESCSCKELDQKVRDAFHLYIEACGINEKLFAFLQAWLYVKDHRNLMRWFKSVGAFINEQKTA